MEATIKFDLHDKKDREYHQHAVRGAEYHQAVHELYNLIKYETPIDLMPQAIMDKADKIIEKHKIKF